jgi:IclR family acetate operon transcriptional repressor
VTKAPEVSRQVERDYTVRAVDRVCAILDLLQGSVAGVSLVDISEATDLPKSSAFRYLWTLEQHRYVERDAGGATFRLGLGFIGMQSRQLEVLRQRVRPWLERLRDQFGETLNFGVLDGPAVAYLEIAESRRGVRLAAQRGGRDPIYSTSLGKAIAANMPEERVRALLEEAPMERRTPNTITSVEDYIAELAKVRRVGYALDNGENEVDGRCVAVAIPDSPIAAALSLSAPATRFPLQDVDQVADALRGAAAQIMPPSGRQAP